MRRIEGVINGKYVYIDNLPPSYIRLYINMRRAGLSAGYKIHRVFDTLFLTIYIRIEKKEDIELIKAFNVKIIDSREIAKRMKSLLEAIYEIRKTKGLYGGFYSE